MTASHKDFPRAERSAKEVLPLDARAVFRRFVRQRTHARTTAVPMNRALLVCHTLQRSLPAASTAAACSFVGGAAQALATRLFWVSHTESAAANSASVTERISVTVGRRTDLLMFHAPAENSRTVA